MSSKQGGWRVGVVQAIGTAGVIVALMFPCSVRGQTSLVGSWRGDLTLPSGALGLVIAIEAGAAPTISVPARGVPGIPITELALADDGTVTFQVPADRAAFEGTLQAVGRIDGTWIQAGQRLPITFERMAKGEEGPEMLTRGQTPVGPFPYVVEEVVVVGDERLACTVTRPRDSDRPVPGAVLLTVAGANDRDQTHSAHKPYMVLADHLTRAGIAVMRCDDRGVGGSTGTLSESTMDELAEDALTLVRDLASREGIGPVGVIGNSEGSIVGSMAAAVAPDDVAFVVLLGGVGVRGAQVIRERMRAQALARGMSAQDVEAALAPFDALTELVSSVGGVGAERLADQRPDLYERLVTVAGTTGARDPLLPQSPEDRVKLFAGPWYHSQLTLNGGEILEQVRVPVLALTGSKDRTNLPVQNLPEIREALTRAGNRDFQVTEMPDLNHVFQTARVGGIAEYGTLEQSFAPVAMELIGRWIHERFGGPR